MLGVLKLAVTLGALPVPNLNKDVRVLGLMLAVVVTVLTALLAVLVASVSAVLQKCCSSSVKVSSVSSLVLAVLQHY